MSLALWAVLAYIAVVLSVVIGQVILSHLLGSRHSGRAANEPYESGIIGQGSARVRFSATFYLIAMFYVIFDLEVVYIIGWAAAFRELGWSGYCKMVIFIVILVIALVYLFRIGALEAGPAPRKKMQELKQD
jgi:NADH-quinone oxidoreductase subunit A